MKKIVLFIMIVSFCSCNKKEEVFVPNFTDFIFFKLNLQENISLKFNGSDTLYFQKRLPDAPIQNYISVLNKEDRDSLISRLNRFNLNKYKSIYANTDANNSQVFIFNKHKKTKSICVIGRSGSIEINNFGDYINKFITKQKIIKTKEYIRFWNLKNVLPPPPPPSKLKKIRFSSDKTNDSDL